MHIILAQYRSVKASIRPVKEGERRNESITEIYDVHTIIFAFILAYFNYELSSI